MIDIILKRFKRTEADHSIEGACHVRRGHLLALTVPTWAPALALNLGNDTSWRAARSNRPRSRCLETGMQTAQQRIGALARFLCRYPTARLTYSVTMVTSPPRVRR